MADYDVIYLGYPNWWGTMPMAVFTFLEAHDLAGKTISRRKTRSRLAGSWPKGLLELSDVEALLRK